MIISKPYITHYRAQQSRKALLYLIDYADQSGDTDVLALASGALAKVDIILRATTAAITTLPGSHTVEHEWDAVAEESLRKNHAVLEALRREDVA